MHVESRISIFIKLLELDVGGNALFVILGFMGY
jgi:hypothetical protein